MPQDQDSSVFSNILTPGSSLNPTFLLIVDGTFLLLFFVFIGLAVVTCGNIHILSLMAIELGLWGGIKWFVSELKQLPEDGQEDKIAEEKKTE